MTGSDQGRQPGEEKRIDNQRQGEGKFADTKRDWDGNEQGGKKLRAVAKEKKESAR